MISAEEGLLGILLLLLEKHAGIDLEIGGTTALQFACPNQHETVAHVLLQARANPDLQPTSGRLCTLQLETGI